MSLLDLQTYIEFGINHELIILALMLVLLKDGHEHISPHLGKSCFILKGKVMSEYKGTWGTYPWTTRDSLDLIHPDEQESALSNPSTYYGRIFFCAGITEEGYLLLNRQDKQYRVKPELYHSRPIPKFKFGDKVKYRKKPERVGIINDLMWHDVRSEYFYFLNIDGKKDKKRYFAEDLELIEE